MNEWICLSMTISEKCSAALGRFMYWCSVVDEEIEINPRVWQMAVSFGDKNESILASASQEGNGAWRNEEK